MSTRVAPRLRVVAVACAVMLAVVNASSQAPPAAVDRRRHQPQARRRPGDLAKRPAGRLHHPRNQLGRERLRDRDLDRRCGDRTIAAGHQRAPVEHPAGVFAGRRVARLRVGSRRQAPAVSHRARRRRGRETDLDGRRRQQFRVVARRHGDRVHDDRSAVRREPRSARSAGATSSSKIRISATRICICSIVAARTTQAADQGQHGGRQFRLVAGRAPHRLRSPRHQRRR